MQISKNNVVELTQRRNLNVALVTTTNSSIHKHTAHLIWFSLTRRPITPGLARVKRPLLAHVHTSRVERYLPPITDAPVPPAEYTPYMNPSYGD